MQSIYQIIIGMAVGFAMGWFGFRTFYFGRLRIINEQNTDQFAQQQMDHMEMEQELTGAETSLLLEKLAFAQEKLKLETKLADLQAEKDRIEHEYIEKNTQLNESQQALTHAADELLNQLQQTLSENARLAEKLTQTTAELQRGQRERSALEHRNKQHRERLKRLEQANAELDATLKKQREEWEQKHMEMDMQAAQAHHAKQHLEEKLAHMEVNMVDTQNMNESMLTIEVKQLQDDKKRLEAESAWQRSHIQALDDEIEQLMARFVRVQESANA